MNKNPDCDGGHCHLEKGKVRLFRLDAGSNLFLCSACWECENQYRHQRGQAQRNWHTAEVYGND